MKTEIHRNYQNSSFTIVVNYEKHNGKKIEVIKFRAYEEVLDSNGTIKYLADCDNPYSNDEFDFTDNFKYVDFYCFGTINDEGVVVLDFNKYKHLILTFYDYSHIKKFVIFFRACTFWHLILCHMQKIKFYDKNYNG